MWFNICIVNIVSGPWSMEYLSWSKVSFARWSTLYVPPLVEFVVRTNAWYKHDMELLLTCSITSLLVILLAIVYSSVIMYLRRLGHRILIAYDICAGLTGFYVLWCCTAYDGCRGQKNIMTRSLDQLKHFSAWTKWHHFAYDIFKRIFLNENVKISIWISLTLVSKGPIDNMWALFE